MFRRLLSLSLPVLLLLSFCFAGDTDYLNHSSVVDFSDFEINAFVSVTPRCTYDVLRRRFLLSPARARELHDRAVDLFLADDPRCSILVLKRRFGIHYNHAKRAKDRALAGVSVDLSPGIMPGSSILTAAPAAIHARAAGTIGVVWSKLTVVCLKRELRVRGLPVGGKKADLVSRLEHDDAEVNYVDESQQLVSSGGVSGSDSCDVDLTGPNKKKSRRVSPSKSDDERCASPRTAGGVSGSDSCDVDLTGPNKKQRRRQRKQYQHQHQDPHPPRLFSESPLLPVLPPAKKMRKKKKKIGRSSSSRFARRPRFRHQKKQQKKR